jgi:hypothetical protein
MKRLMKREDRQVDLAGVVDLIHEHLTDALCSAVFQATRTRERVRVWTLHHLMRFWVWVIAFAPPSLRSALAEARGPAGGRFQVPDVSAASFFKRCQRLRPVFAGEIFRKFSEAVRRGGDAFHKTLHPVRERFAAIEAVDASDLDQVRRRLKVLWKDRRVPLGGMILGFYDVCAGMIRDLVFEPKVGTSEFGMALQALERVARATLLVGDRLYGVPKFAAACRAKGIFLLGRLFSAVQVSRERLLSTTPHEGGALEDWEATVGSGQTAKPQTVRVIRWRKGRSTRLELLTTVASPKRLSAVEAMEVYRSRWKIERLFSDLKVVLNLKSLYAANTNAVALQLYATAILHTALRACQARIARQAKVEPEDLSTQKLFPRLVIASSEVVTMRSTILAVERLNPGINFKKPGTEILKSASTPLSTLLVERRTSRKTGRTRPIARWRSLPSPEPPEGSN